MRYRSLSTFLWAMMKPYKWHYGLMLLAPILGAFYDFANNYALKLVVDAFAADAPVSYLSLAWPIFIFVAAQILLDFLWRISDVAEWRAEPYVRQAIILEVYQHVQDNPYFFFQNTPTGSITSKVRGILDGYDDFWAAMHHEFTPKVANTIVLTAVLAVVNVKICLLVALWGLSLFAIMYRFSKTLNKLSIQVANDQHRIFGLIADNIVNILTILSFATKKKESNRLDTLIQKELIPSSIKNYQYGFFSSIVAAVLYWIMMICLFVFMIHLRKTQQVSSGDLVFVMGITIKMGFELWEMIHKMQDLMKDVGDFKSAFELLKLPVVDEKTHQCIQIKKPSIVFEHIAFDYEPGKPIFSDLSLSIQAGEKVGIVGVSGAGKSTLISLLLKYFPITQGRIFIDNQNIMDYTADSLRAQVAVIPQDILLFHRTIFDNIAYGAGNRDCSPEEVIQAAKAANVHEFVMQLPEQYQTLVGERGVKLSGGQRQRIAIARAMLKQAPILILDEATSSLDTQTEQLIQDSLNQLLDNASNTVLAIAHRLSTLKHMDRIIVLDHGQVIEEGTHQALISRGSFYKKLWDMQQI